MMKGKMAEKKKTHTSVSEVSRAFFLWPISKYIPTF